MPPTRLWQRAQVPSHLRERIYARCSGNLVPLLLVRAKIATKSLRAGPVLAARKREKHQNHKQIPAGRTSFCENTCFSQFFARRTSRAVYQRGRKKTRKTRARVAARSEIPMGTARRARKERGWRKKICFLRAPPGGNSYCDLHRAHDFLRKT